MSKFLQTAALVVGGVALGVATLGVGSALAAGFSLSAAIGTAGAATIAGIGISAGTLAIAAGGLGLASGLLAKKPSTSSGSQTSFKADPTAGIPYAMGRTLVGGNIIYRKVHGSDNVYQSDVVILSGAGPVQSIDGFYVDDVLKGVAGNGAVAIPDAGFMYEFRQLGASPVALALSGHWAGMPSWGSASKLSGYAASLVQLQYDTKGKNTMVTTPKCGWLGHWVRVYDPRLDGTYPGGSGAQRWDDEGTWTWSENPYLHALTWCIGRNQNGKRILGLGARLDQIIVSDFVEGANVAQANGWTLGGVVYSRPDTKWNVLKQMLQAGGGEPMRVGARIGCLVPTPRVSLATVRSGDIVGDCSLPATQSRRERINGVVPRYRSEDHAWEIVPADVVRVQAYVPIDGDERTREVEYSLVQNVDQAAQLGAYDIGHSREYGPGTFPLKPAWLNYRAGDCVTFDIPEMAGQKVLILNRSLDPSTCVVTFTVRSETDSKHAFALGRTGVAPGTASLSTSGFNPLKSLSNDAASLQLAISASFPIGLTITAAADGSTVISDHVRRYNDGHADVAVTGATIQSGLAAGSFRAIGYDDEDRLGGAVTYLLEENDIDARSSPDAPGRHYVGYATIPTAGSPPSSGGGATPPGGYCVTIDTPLLMEPGAEKSAGEIVVGDRLWTRHEEQLDAINGGWRSYPVEAIEIVDSDDVWEATVGGKLLRATGDHLVYTGTWVAMRNLGAKVDGTYQVAKITVTGAHTYVSNGILSHNIKQNQPVNQA